MKEYHFKKYALAASARDGISPCPLAAQSAQNQGSKPVICSTTRLVVVDVVATDVEGSPVTGLKAEDFTVTENGESKRWPTSEASTSLRISCVPRPGFQHSVQFSCLYREQRSQCNSVGRHQY